MPDTFMALLNYSMADVGSSQWIVYGTDPVKHVLDVASSLVGPAISLVEHHAEEVNCAELDLLHENYGESDYPADGWSWQDITKLLTHLPEIAVAQYEQSGIPWVKNAHWFTDLLGFLNDIMPPESGVWLNMEDTIGKVLPALVISEAKAVQFYKMSDDFAKWLGRLVVVSQWDWTKEITKSDRSALGQLIQMFNDTHVFS
jgi:hypothetical protein